MADEGFAGRKIVLTWGGAEIKGVREKGIKLDGTPIDVTSDEDNGWQTLLSYHGEKKVEISIAGVTKDPHLKADWFAGDTMKAVTITYPDGREMAGTFLMTNFSEKGPYKDATTFDATLMSSGRITFTPYS